MRTLNTSQVEIGLIGSGVREKTSMSAGITGTLNSFVEWFIPDPLSKDPRLVQRVRMFLISHLVGPFLGYSIIAFLLIVEPSPGAHVWVLAATMTAFWAFPFALKLFPTQYNALALVSVVNLTF